MHHSDHHLFPHSDPDPLEPDDICQLPIHLQFSCSKVSEHLFPKGETKDTTFSHPLPILYSQTIYRKHFKKYLDELEHILKEEYKELLAEEQDGNRQKRLVDLIINKKVVYVQIRVGDKMYGTDADKQFEAVMFVVIRDFEGPSKAGVVKDGSSRVKVMCLYSNEGSSGEIIRAVEPHETTVSALSQQFGQHL